MWPGDSESEFVRHEPCPACGSTNNLGRYDDGHGYCFGCAHYERGGDVEGSSVVEAPAPGTTDDWIRGAYMPLVARGLSADTCRKFGYAVAGEVQVADYYDQRGRRVAQKIRRRDKTFAWRGLTKQAALFGQQLWNPGKRVVVTEGEIDAMSVSQVQGNRWPVVSVKNGVGGAVRDLAASLEWLEGFEEIVLAFDNDDPGQKCAQECAELFTPGKVRLLRYPGGFKDANEMLVAGKHDDLRRAVWEAAPWRPDGIVRGVDLIDRLLAPPPPAVPYPWDGLNRHLRGQRRGEITTVCAGTGVGKSQVMREITFNLRERGERVGVVALEESVVHAATAQVGLLMGKILHDPAVRERVGPEAIADAAKIALEGVYFYEHFGSIDYKVLLPRIRYMVKALGVSHIIIDHISIMVSGTATEGDERKRIDELMTHLRVAVEELGIGMHIVSHLRKASGTPHEEGGRVTLDDLRGSGAIKQISNNIIALERNQQAEDALERNTTTVRVLKCRLFGEATGVACRLRYSPETGRLTEVTDEPPLEAAAEDEYADF